MTLRPNQQVTAEISKTDVTIKQKLGEGGQGEVFLVEGFSKPMVLKWYNAEQATDEQKSAILHLVQKGVPKVQRGDGSSGPLIWRRFKATGSLAT